MVKRGVVINHAALKRGFIPLPGGQVVLVLIEQHQLINDYSA